MPQLKCCQPNWISVRLTLIAFISIIISAAKTDAAVTALPSSSLDYDGFDTISSELYDLDTEQSQARYDPRTLSKEFLDKKATKQLNTFRLSDFDETAIADDNFNGDETKNGDGAHCLNGDRRYEHGEKIRRADPCEICLCIDGEVFCWWKKCFEHTISKHPKNNHSKAKRKHNRYHHHHQQQQRQQQHHRMQHMSVDYSMEKFQSENDNKNEQKPAQAQQKSHAKMFINKQFVEPKLKSRMQKGPIKSPKHRTVHIMNLDVSETDPDDAGMRESTPVFISEQGAENERQTLSSFSVISTSTPASASSATKTTSRVSAFYPENVLNSNGPFVHADIANELAENRDNIHNGVVLNDRVTSVSLIERDENARKMLMDVSNSNGNNNNNNNNNNNYYYNNKNHNNDNNVTKPVILANNKLLSTMENLGAGSANGRQPSVSDDSADGSYDKSFYEKTIVNKNGVFIENIRKISNTAIDQSILGAIGDNENDDAAIDSVKRKSDDSNDDEYFTNANHDNEYDTNGNKSSSKISYESTKDEINRKSIELMNNVPAAHAQHYLITSSGKIEKTDSLASDDILAQFQSGLTNTINYNNANQSNSNYFNVNNAFNMNSNNNSRTVKENDNDNEPHAPKQQSIAANAQPNQKVTSTATATTTTNFAVVSANLDTLPGGIFLTTLNSAIPALVTTSTLSDQSNTNCIVMGKSYKIGTVLPQETGNCLQCLCVKGANEGDAPRVTCSPHNCPPLILPDLFDSTGY